MTAYRTLRKIALTRLSKAKRFGAVDLDLEPLIEQAVPELLAKNLFALCIAACDAEAKSSVTANGPATAQLVLFDADEIERESESTELDERELLHSTITQLRAWAGPRVKATGKPGRPTGAASTSPGRMLNAAIDFYGIGDFLDGIDPLAPGAEGEPGKRGRRSPSLESIAHILAPAMDGHGVSVDDLVTAQREARRRKKRSNHN